MEGEEKPLIVLEQLIYVELQQAKGQGYQSTLFESETQTKS